MKKQPYKIPELEVLIVNIEQGFAQTSNVEDPIIKPDQDW